jgi:hypothetical protein
LPTNIHAKKSKKLLDILLQYVILSYERMVMNVKKEYQMLRIRREDWEKFRKIAREERRTQIEMFYIIIERYNETIKRRS